MERATDRRRLDNAGAFLQPHADRLIVSDEVHRVPELFAELRSVIDERRRIGQRFKQFLLLGSASLDLVQNSAETLVGRVAYLELKPINFQEDHDQGGILNLARLGQALGTSAQTISRYIDLLVDLLLVRRLPAWSGDLNKRLVRSPRIYIRDSGLVHSLLEIENGYQLQGHVAVGASWEGFVIESVINAVAPNLKPYFFRTQDGAEIDLVLEKAGKPFIAIEVKRSSAPKVQQGFYIACNQLNIAHRYVIAPVDEAYPIKGGVQVLGLGAALAAISSHHNLRNPADLHSG